MTEEPSDRIFAFVFGFFLFGVPTFLIMGVLTGRVGPNLDSVFTWIVILLPTLCFGCIGGYKTATNKIYKYKPRNRDLSGAITKVHSRGQSVETETVAKTLGEVEPAPKASRGYVFVLSRMAILVAMFIVACLISPFMGK